MVLNKEGTVDYAEIKLDSENEYIRVTLVDEQGKKAFTNAYFLDEILK